MFEDTDVLDYFPLQKGKFPPSSAIMTKMSAVPPEHKDIFQIDKYYSWFMDNKDNSRLQDLSRYYQTRPGVDRSPIIRHMIERLCAENPHMFKWDEELRQLWCSYRFEFLKFDDSLNLVESGDLFGNKAKYVDALDALAMQVPEDIIVCTMGDDGKDFVSSAHLMAPAGWSPMWAIGKSFAEIHEDVRKSDGKPVIKNPSAMVNGIIRMGTPIQRVGAISFRSDRVLNLHPDHFVKNKWTWDDEQEVYLRFERQTVTPFPEINSFLFTVKGYWNNLLHPKRIGLAIEALENIHKNVYHRDFLKKEGDNLLAFLKRKKASYEKLGL